MTTVLRFGRVEIAPAMRRVSVDGREVPLGGRAFDVLAALVERRDRIVTKDELLAAAWPDVIVEENNLQVQISALRRALGHDAIATIAGRGYLLRLEPDRAAPSADAPTGLPAPVTSLVGREADLAALAALRGDGVTAACLLGASDGISERHALALEASVEKVTNIALERGRALLDPAAFDAAWAAGRILDGEGAFAEACAWLDGIPA